MDRSFPFIGKALISFCLPGMAAATCLMAFGAAVAPAAQPGLPMSSLLRPPSDALFLRTNDVPLFLYPRSAPPEIPVFHWSGAYFPDLASATFRAPSSVVSQKTSPASESAPPPPPPVAVVPSPKKPANLPTNIAPQKDLDDSSKQAAELEKMIATAKNAASPAEVEADFRRILSEPLPGKLQGQALFEFAAYLDKKEINLIKAAVVYENFLSLDPSSVQAPFVNLRLADIYQKIGAEDRSVNRLYEVLSSSIRTNGEPKAAALTRQAMLKIGNAHFEAEHYEEAAGIYSRLKLLELPPEDQAFVLYRASDLLFRRKQYEGAIAAGRQFLAGYPNSEFVPACRHMIVQSLAASGHPDEAVEEILELLRSTQKDKETDQALASHWKLETGNDLANVLYSRGEFLRALHIYQALANLSNDPAWKLATVYQIGLCFERLREPVRAIEAYAYIAKATLPGVEPPKTVISPVGMSFSEMQESAAWHAKHLEWMVDVGTKLYPILSSKIRSQPPAP